MNKVFNIAEATNNNRLWTPEDCLRNFINALEDGKVKPTALSIVYMEEDGNKTVYGYQNSNLSFQDHISMLEIAKDMVITRFKG